MGKSEDFLDVKELKRELLDKYIYNKQKSRHWIFVDVLRKMTILTHSTSVVVFFELQKSAPVLLNDSKRSHQ